MSDRTESIETYFREAMSRVGAIGLPLTPERWEAEAPEDPSNLHRPFGWMPPYQRAPGLFVFRFCPTLIASQTAHLDDKALTEYLEAVSFCADLHITHWELSDDDREALITRALYDIASGSLALLGDVQMRALDAAKAAEA